MEGQILSGGDWIKLHRQSLDSQVFADAQLWRIWCWCLLKANWKSSFFKGREVKPGQFISGRASASNELGISGSAWYRAIQRLQEHGCLTIEANNRFTLISIEKWADFQEPMNSQWTTGEQPVNSQWTASEQPKQPRSEQPVNSQTEAKRGHSRTTVYPEFSGAKVRNEGQNRTAGGQPVNSQNSPEVNSQWTASEQPLNSPKSRKVNTIEEEKNIRREEYSFSLSHEFFETSEFSEQWERYVAHLWECWQSRLGQVQAEAILMELGRTARDADDAAAMIAYSVARGAKNIITNGDHRADTGKKAGKGGQASRRRVPELEEDFR